MAKFVYKTHDDYRRVELEAEVGEEISAEQAAAWALTRLAGAIEFVGVAVQTAGDEIASQLSS